MIYMTGVIIAMMINVTTLIEVTLMVIASSISEIDNGGDNDGG